MISLMKTHDSQGSGDQGSVIMIYPDSSHSGLSWLDGYAGYAHHRWLWRISFSARFEIDGKVNKTTDINWLVVSTPPKNISQLG